MPDSEPAHVGQLEFEAARDAILAVLAFYAEQIDIEERRAEPDDRLVAHLVQERIVFGAVLRELQTADAAGVARITETACATLVHLEEGRSRR